MKAIMKTTVGNTLTVEGEPAIVKKEIQFFQSHGCKLEEIDGDGV